MEAGAIPGIAIPLLQDGCANTTVDIDWVWDAIYENSEDQTRRLNLEALRKRVNSWFSAESLHTMLSPVEYETEEVALRWLAKSGKRWRPFLAVCAYLALSPDDTDDWPRELVELAVAVECFHKASLIHDDIEDHDMLRYGQKTLHAQYGVPIALNVGDYLLGLGYHLLAQLKAPSERKTRMLQVAAEGHRFLCLGQGSELSWMRKPRPLTVAEVIDIYRNKTSPAFAVALTLGALLAGGGNDVTGILRQYSDALGVAYQIKDDIDDFNCETGSSDLNAMRPSLLVAMAYERAAGPQKKLLESAWRRSAKFDKLKRELGNVFAQLEIEHVAFLLMESYKSEATNSLSVLTNANLKGLLRRVIGRIFNDFEVMSCCSEYKSRYAQDGRSS